jgi:XapX domain-containing protein
MEAVALGIVLCALIGGACRVADIPVPAPPALVGALLVVAMTLGYLAGGHVAF